MRETLSMLLTAILIILVLLVLINVYEMNTRCALINRTVTENISGNGPGPATDTAAMRLNYGKLYNRKSYPPNY